MRSILRWSSALGLFLMGLLLGRYRSEDRVTLQIPLADQTPR
jgi:hypothetical protein